MNNYNSMRLAVLVDADNVSPDDLDDLLIQIAGLGGCDSQAYLW